MPIFNEIFGTKDSKRLGVKKNLAQYVGVYEIVITKCSVSRQFDLDSIDRFTKT